MMQKSAKIQNCSGWQSTVSGGSVWLAPATDLALPVNGVAISVAVRAVP